MEAEWGGELVARTFKGLLVSDVKVVYNVGS